MEKYEKIRTVGRGAYGTVYLCRRIADKMLVIVKQICVDQMTKEERLVSLNESKVLSRLKHPNIIAYYENFLEEQSIVIVMEYAPGGTLYDYLQQREGKLLSEEEVLYYFSQIVLALHHVHSQQILHRDLKSHNILLSEKKNVIKIGDFGISKILSSKSKAYTNLPALVMKIIRGSFAPVAEHYSKELRKLLLTLLDTDPNKRPTINQIMAYPIMITPIFSLYVTIGSLSSIGKNNSSKQNAIKQVGSVTDNLDCSAHNAKYMSQMSSSRIYCWGDSVSTPFLLPLPMSDTEITTVAIGENQKVGITKNGLLISWEINSLETTSVPQYTARLLQEKAAVNIIHVACGKDFTVCLTDRSLLLSYGNGDKGCLGHGDFKSLLQPKIVEVLLGLDVTSVACGAAHVVVVTGEHEVYAWGQGSYGQLGLNQIKNCNQPQKISLPPDCHPKSVLCGSDCSFLLTSNHGILACGSNRHNKLAMDTEDGQHVDGTDIFELMRSDPIPNLKIVSVSAGLSHTAILTDKGDLYTIGSNRYGQLGWGQIGLSHNMPCKVQFINHQKFKRVSCGNSFTIAVTEAGEVYSWGENSNGQLGRNSSNLNKPGKIETINAKYFKSCSLVSSDTCTLLCLSGNQ
ncbi:serine/threonine-protein kinase Nek8-like isoform X2 [Centruroides vittatus]|uniref:serine/threonine-protein kinase Nek8-like isoform X2 n=1 Tax=Centruroides vittatus TaxID=120091 RepID=UPI00350EE6CA